MTDLDQDVETVRNVVLASPNWPEADAALDRILARITELEEV